MSNYCLYRMRNARTFLGDSPPGTLPGPALDQQKDSQCPTDRQPSACFRYPMKIFHNPHKFSNPTTKLLLLRIFNSRGVFSRGHQILKIVGPSGKSSKISFPWEFKLKRILTIYVSKIIKLQSFRALMRYLNDGNLTHDRKRQQFKALLHRNHNRTIAVELLILLQQV